MEETYRKDLEKRLNKSDSAVKKVFDYILKTGTPCHMNPTRCVPKGGNPNNYKDNGDLYIHQRTEVKHNPGMTWTGMDDFPYSDLIICNCSSIDDQGIPPLMFYIVNGPKTHAAEIDVSKTRHHWFKQQIYDSYRGYS